MSRPIALAGLVLGLALVHAPPPAQVHAQLARGHTPWLVLLCDTPDAPTEAPVSRFESLFSSESLTGFWDEVSYGRMDLGETRVEGWFTMPEEAAQYSEDRGDGRSGLDLERITTDCLAAASSSVDWTEHERIALMLSFTSSEAVGGYYRVPYADTYLGRWMTWIPNPWALSTIAHEMGHAYGWLHLFGAGVEYNDPWGIMGRTCRPPVLPLPRCLPRHPVAVHKVLEGWTEGREVEVAAGESYRGRLERLALPTGNDPLVALVPIRGDPSLVYSIEARQKAGWDRNLLGEGVIIHRVEHMHYLDGEPRIELVGRGPGDYTRSALKDSLWSPGQAFVDDANLVRIAVLERDETGFTVEVENGYPASIAERLYLPRVFGDPRLAP